MYVKVEIVIRRISSANRTNIRQSWNTMEKSLFDTVEWEQPSKPLKYSDFNDE